VLKKYLNIIKRKKRLDITLKKKNSDKKTNIRHKNRPVLEPKKNRNKEISKSKIDSVKKRLNNNSDKFTMKNNSIYNRL
jgi:hypothetical protein